ncbi:uncharacterized protein LOC124411607 [Diprion similis]|uniref:uncharacterized protein LOC124411607 n=1 Tax=Diprion similis TaxID=362088 RepID=UPI001EF8E3D4|nr:uncharacterized protein LOC124411607 [Diprion similis]
MKRLASLFLIIILTAEYASAVSLRRRRDASDESMESSNGVNSAMMDHVRQLINQVEGFPFIGDIVENVLNQVLRITIQLDNATNGAFSRMMNKVMPCTIAVEGSTVCSGDPMVLQIREFTINVINQFFPPWARIVMTTVMDRINPNNFSDNR